jgi:hypothetical protein
MTPKLRDAFRAARRKNISAARIGRVAGISERTVRNAFQGITKPQKPYEEAIVSAVQKILSDNETDVDSLKIYPAQPTPSPQETALLNPSRNLPAREARADSERLKATRVTALSQSPQPARPLTSIKDALDGRGKK